nr:putative peptidoglycan glycosyltransferase FtsW [Corynebacterium alimapuense]
MDSHPGIDYFMIRSVVFLITGIGIVMVLSSSMTWSILDGDTVWSQAMHQGTMVIVGLVAFIVALRMKPTLIRTLAPWLLGIALVLLVLVLIPGIGTGRAEVGSQSWIVVGPLRLQPSEVAKVAIAIWGASFLSPPANELPSLHKRLRIYAIVAIVMAGLIALEGDIGMAMSFAVLVIFTLFFAGSSIRSFLSAIAVVAVGLVGLLLAGGFRSSRFIVYFDAFFGRFEDTQGTAFQSYQGFLSLADGSTFGVGLGQSRAKWFYLPEAKNDFIFAVIGEELGLWGGILVIGLFGLLGYFGLRTALRAQDRFQSLMAATLTASVVSQAFINIGYVIGLLPVTGIQLPMISAGGTSAIITLGSMGLLANIARHEPEAISATQSYGRPLFDRLLLMPEPGAPASTDSYSRPRERFGAPVTGSVKEETRNDRRRQDPPSRRERRSSPSPYDRRR